MSEDSDSPIVCSRCGRKLTLKVGRKSGEPFWSCGKCRRAYPFKGTTEGACHSGQVPCFLCPLHNTPLCFLLQLFMSDNVPEREPRADVGSGSKGDESGEGGEGGEGGSRSSKSKHDDHVIDDDSGSEQDEGVDDDSSSRQLSMF
jgi:hypothetical protein